MAHVAAAGTQVQDGHSFQPKKEWVQHPGWEPPEHDPEQLDWETLHVAPQDIRRRTYRDPNPPRAALHQIDGNFSAAVPRANYQHVLVVIRLRIAVIHRMNRWSIECARPPRQMRKPGISGGHHDHPRWNRAGSRADSPVAVITVNTRGINPEPRHEAMVCRVPL